MITARAVSAGGLYLGLIGGLGLAIADIAVLAAAGHALLAQPVRAWLMVGLVVLILSSVILRAAAARRAAGDEYVTGYRDGLAAARAAQNGNMPARVTQMPARGSIRS